MEDFHWQIRTTFDSRNPVITSESPLFVKINRPGFHGPITDEALERPGHGSVLSALLGGMSCRPTGSLRS